jgi:hypothetical protein
MNDPDGFWGTFMPDGFWGTAMMAAPEYALVMLLVITLAGALLWALWPRGIRR